MQLSSLKGLGPKRLEALKKMKIDSVEELIRLAPSDYMDMSRTVLIADMPEDGRALIFARITSAPYQGRSKTVFSACADQSASADLIWFNAPYIARNLKKGEMYRIFGRASKRGSKTVIVNPKFEHESKHAMQGIIPVYPIPKGAELNQNVLRYAIRQALDCSAQQPEIYPEQFRERYSLPEINFALENIHFPRTFYQLALAKKRMVFDELLLMLSIINQHKRSQGRLHGEILLPGGELKEAYDASLRFKLTNAQKRCIKEIEEDVCSGRVMNRLLQGDVGSGKTAVAFYALLLSVYNGGQAALMAPTEVLARQHFHDFTAQFPQISAALLCGSTKKSEKERIKSALKDGSIKVLIGTHAIIQEDVSLPLCKLIVTDEQHRFGVAHRALLGAKSEGVHTLVMSATPIPRTLSLVLYSDLDFSVLDEMPPGRQKISTHIIPPQKEQAMYEYIAQCALTGKQSYIVCPVIEESDSLPVMSAEELYIKLSEGYLKNISVGLLHGKMSVKDKNAVIEKFSSGEIKVLVSTTVIEVGVNVPKAVNMVIENAARFGLAQLHQLRGRVGRGSEKSYCFLLDADGQNARLKTMTQTSDGFEIAEKDLELRGPGEYFGTRQSGLPSAMFSSVFSNKELLETAKEAYSELLSKKEFASVAAALEILAKQKLEREETNIVYN